ncbi:MAG: peptidylprolyl isomerase [Patescibacteria group bacterium]
MSKVLHGSETHHQRRALPIRYVVAFFIFLALILSALILVWGFMFAHWTGSGARTISAVIHFPAARVNSRPVSYHDVAELALVAELQGKEDPFFTALETTIDRKIMIQLASEIGTGISEEELRSYPLDQADIDELLAEVDWTVDDYRHYVIEPLLLYQTVDRDIKKSKEHQTIALAEMQSIIENIELGVSFADLALQYSEHSSYAVGGDLGYLQRGDFADGMDFIFDMDIGEVTDVLEWEDYFVVAMVYDVAEEGGERSSVGVRMIAIEKDDLSVIFDEYKKEQEVKIFTR